MSKEDGTTFGMIVQGVIEKRFDYLREGSATHSEYQVQKRTPSGEIIGLGRIDLLVSDRYVVDFKTDDLSGIEKARAAWLGNEYGRQVAEYVNSPQVRALSGNRAEGHLYMVGKPSTDPEVRDAFRQAAEKHSVSVTFCDSGNPHRIARQIGVRFLGVTPQVKPGNSVSASRPAELDTNSARTLVAHRLRTLNLSLREVEGGFAVRYGQMRFGSDGINISANQRVDRADPLMVASIFGSWTVKKVKETECGQKLAARWEEFQTKRLYNRIMAEQPVKKVETATSTTVSKPRDPAPQPAATKASISVPSTPPAVTKRPEPAPQVTTRVPVTNPQPVRQAAPPPPPPSSTAAKIPSRQPEGPNKKAPEPKRNDRGPGMGK